jgi:amino acid permease
MGLLNTEAEYTSLPGGADCGLKRCSSRDFNLFEKSREYLAGKVMPATDFDSPGTMRKLPSVETLRKNTLQHNTQDLTQVMPDGGILRPLQPGSERTCVLTLVATALGSGVLALPYAFSRVGLVTGLLGLSLAACLGCVTLTILMMASRYTEVNSFAALLALASGSNKTGLMLDAMLVLYGIAAILALLIFEGDFIPEILEAYQMAVPSRSVCILIVAACAWPTVIPSEVSALRYVAALSPFAILYVACNVVAQTHEFHAARPDRTEVKMSEWDPALVLEAMFIFVFGVMCHSNAVPVAQLLERPSVNRIVKVASYSNMCCWALYMLIGVGGYLSFQVDVKGNFLANYPVGRVSILICRQMMAVVCYVGIPMNSSNCVTALQRLALSAIRGDCQPQEEHRPVLFAFFATIVLALAAVAAIHLTNVALVISIVGGSLTTVQMFWIPAYVYWKILYPTQPRIFRRCLMVVLVTFGVLGFTSVIVTLISRVA